MLTYADALQYKFFERPANWQKKLADESSNKKHVEEGIRFEVTDVC
jgi:hypothetical protein